MQVVICYGKTEAAILKELRAMKIPGVKNA
jgi:hypothetical protein